MGGSSKAIDTSPLSPNWVGEAPPSGRLLGLAAHTPAAIRDGVVRLAPVLQMARERGLWRGRRPKAKRAEPSLRPLKYAVC